MPPETGAADAAQVEAGMDLAVFVPYLIFALLAVTALVVTVFVLKKASDHSTRLILIGITIAVTAIGFGTLTPQGADQASNSAELSATLMRIAVILVLGGVAAGIIRSDGANAAAAARPRIRRRPTRAE